MENAKQRLIIVSNRPPISLTESGGVLRTKRAPGGLASALARVWERPGSLWVGWSGLGRSFSRAEFESLELDHKLALINLESGLYRRYYNGFANGTLWPVFHGFEPRRVYDDEDLSATMEVTERFAGCLEQVAGPDDMIWIHDFHLVFLPDVLRRLGLQNQIGFFLHIPFPDPEMFRRLPHHREIAQSLLRTNLLGFQTEADVAKFMRYASEEDLDIGSVEIGAFPIGIDYPLYSQARKRPEALKFLQGIRERYSRKKVIFSVSRLDYTKGIMHQLRAVDALLSRTRRRDLIYKLVVQPSREALGEYQKVKRESVQLAREINRRHGKAGWQPVEYDYRSYGLDELVAWYRRANVLLLLPLADGMNLVAKEYVAAAGDDGALVLSDRAGVAAQLQEAFQVDPEDTAGAAQALHQALAMLQGERRRRMRALKENVRTYDVRSWADGFLQTLAGPEMAEL